MDGYSLGELKESEGLWDWNLTTNRIHYSPRWISMLGYEEHELGNTPNEWLQRIHPEEIKEVQEAIDEHLAASSEFECEHRLLHKDGTYRWMRCRGLILRDENGAAVRMAGGHSDITPQKVVDPLTGLPNRRLLFDRLRHAIELSKRHGNFLFALLLVNLDRFNRLIERLGPAGADQLLVATARRLETGLRAADTVPRAGREYLVSHFEGDEFAILLEGLNDIGEAKIVAERLLQELSTPFTLGGREVLLTASIGIALGATGYVDAEQALRDADIAMYRAKTLGKACCEVFDTAILDSAKAEIRLEADLREALKREELAVHYQPIITLASGRIAGFEALVRWHRPGRGLTYPGEFIPAAERAGLIAELGRWVLGQACGQLKAWQETLGIPEEVWVSVNISSLQLQPSMLEEVERVLEETGLNPRCLLLELTESAVMENPSSATTLLMQLRFLGTRIALDDFGTGYSSLGYLRRFPAEFLKVDRCFVGRLESNSDHTEIIRSVGNLARQLGMSVIVEGIEKEEQKDLILSLDCEYGQGFLFSKAVDSERAAELLEAQYPRPPERNLQEEADDQRSAKTRHGPYSRLGRLSWGRYPEALLAELGRRGLTVGRGLLLAAMAAMILTGGAIVTFKGASPQTNPLRPEVEGTMEVPAEAGMDIPSGTPVDSKGAGAIPQETSVKPAEPPPKSSPKIPLSYAFPVIHDHVIGSCKGTLKLTRDAVSFVSEKEKDSFTCKYSEITCAVSDDKLTIKTDSRTYRFKSGQAGSEEENRSRLQEIFSSIARIHPKMQK